MKKLVILFILIFSVSAYSQTDTCLKTLAGESLARKIAEEKVNSLTAQIKLKDEIITTLNNQVVTLEKIVANVDSQNSNYDEIRRNNAEVVKNLSTIIQDLRTQISLYSDEVIALRKEVNSARKWGDVKSGISFGAGLLVGTKVN